MRIKRKGTRDAREWKEREGKVGNKRGNGNRRHKLWWILEKRRQ